MGRTVLVSDMLSLQLWLWHVTTLMGGVAAAVVGSGGGRGRRRRGGFAFGQAFPLPPLRRRTSPWPHAHNCFIHTKLPSHLCSEVSDFYYF